MKSLIASRFWLWAINILTGNSLIVVITNSKGIIGRINYFFMILNLQKSMVYFDLNFVPLECLCIKRCFYSHRNTIIVASAQRNLHGICSQSIWQKVFPACNIISVILILGHSCSHLPSSFSDGYTIACLDQGDLRYFSYSL